MFPEASAYAYGDPMQGTQGCSVYDVRSWDASTANTKSERDDTHISPEIHSRRLITSPDIMTGAIFSASIFLKKVANWDGKTQDIYRTLAAAFEAADYLDCIKNLRARNIDPLSYINSLDKVGSCSIPTHQSLFITIWWQIIDSLPSDSDQRKRCIRALRKTCGLYGILPASYIIPSALSSPGKRPFASGGFSDVWRLTDERNHDQVFAVKSLRVYEQDPSDKINKVWSCPIRNLVELISDSFARNTARRL